MQFRSVIFSPLDTLGEYISTMLQSFSLLTLSPNFTEKLETLDTKSFLLVTQSWMLIPILCNMHHVLEYDVLADVVFENGKRAIRLELACAGLAQGWKVTR